MGQLAAASVLESEAVGFYQTPRLMVERHNKADTACCAKQALVLLHPGEGSSCGRDGFGWPIQPKWKLVCLCRENAQAQVRNSSTSIAAHRLPHEHASAMHRITCIGRHMCVPQQGQLTFPEFRHTNSKWSGHTIVLVRSIRQCRRLVSSHASVSGFVPT